MLLNVCNLGRIIFATNLEMILTTLCLLSRQQGCFFQLVTQIQPTAADTDQLKCLPFLPPTITEQLEEELPTYLATASALASSSNSSGCSGYTLEWWKNSSVQLFKLLNGYFLLQPSSAAAECAFPILVACCMGVLKMPTVLYFS